MLHGDISNLPGLTVAVDFDALLDPPAKRWQQVLADWIDGNPNRRWYLGPLVLRWRPLDTHAERWAWWAFECDVRIIVVIRGVDNILHRHEIRKTLKDESEYAYPNIDYFFADRRDMEGQGRQIDWYCKSRVNALRFYTKDQSLSYYLPRSLVRIIRDWTELRGFE